MIEVSNHILSNGLKIIHNRDITTRFAAVNILYGVGSKNEDPQFTGLAHLFEHLMFSGSKNVPDFDKALQVAGGESNAWTNQDFTNYYETLPIQNIETALWIESDRMKSLDISDENLSVQKSVVIEEYKERCLNRPYGDLGHLICSNSFKKHPYRWPVIGKDISDIEKVSMNEVSSFFKKFYSPSNAILSVVGNIDFDKLIIMAEKWFGGIKSNIITPTNYEFDDSQSGSNIIKIEKQVPQNMIIKAYRMCGRRDSCYQASDIISDVLANGQSSRFFKNIVSKGRAFTSLDASIWGTVDPGLMLIQGRLAPNSNYEEGEKIIDEAIIDLLQNTPTQKEIDKCVNKFESRELFNILNQGERAQKMAICEYLKDSNYINSEIEAYRALKPDNIQEVATNIFNPENCSTIYYGHKE